MTDSRSSAPARAATRASTPTVSSSTASRARFPLPDFSRRVQVQRRTGATSRPPACCARSSGTTPRRRLRSVGRRDRLGHQPQLQPQAHAKQRRPPAVRCRRRHPELHERLAGRRRHRQQLRQPGDADRRRGDADRRRGVAFLDHTWSDKFSTRRRLLVAGQRQHRGAGAGRVQGRPLRARQPALLPGAERDGRRRIPVGPPRELLRRVPSDGFKIQFSFKYNFSWKLGG